MSITHFLWREHIRRVHLQLHSSLAVRHMVHAYNPSSWKAQAGGQNWRPASLCKEILCQIPQNPPHSTQKKPQKTKTTTKFPDIQLSVLGYTYFHLRSMDLEHTEHFYSSFYNIQLMQTIDLWLYLSYEIIVIFKKHFLMGSSDDPSLLSWDYRYTPTYLAL